MRELRKNPVVPRLDTGTVELLNQLCFRQDDVSVDVELVFVFATLVNEERVGALVTQILSQRQVAEVFLTGGITTKELPEADNVLKCIDTGSFPNTAFYAQRTSTNLRADVIDALGIHDFSSYQKVLFITKSHAAGRSYLTLKKFLPASKLHQLTYNPKYDEASLEITRENWHTFKFGTSRVWGEFERIREYGRRGDIEFDEVMELVQAIEARTATD